MHGRYLFIAQRGYFIQHCVHAAAVRQGGMGHFALLLAPVNVLCKNIFSVAKFAVCTAHMQRNHKNRLVFAQRGRKVCAGVCQKGYFLGVVGKMRRLG